MPRYLTEKQVAAFQRDGFLVVPDFVSEEHCLALRERAMQLAEQHVPSPEQATIFTADGKPLHAGDDYFLSSGEAIRCFFEKDAFDAAGHLRDDAHLCLNKLGHAMHDLDPVFDSFSRTPQLAAVASDIGMIEPLLLQSMYIFKQPRIGGEVTCHTDHTYLWTEPRSVVGFWFAIDDATTENGCMWALPGGHRLPVRERSRLNEARTSTVTDVLVAEPYPLDSLACLEAKRGTLVLLDGAVPHLSAANNSDKPRHAYTIHAIDGVASYLDDNWLQRPTLPMRGFAPSTTSRVTSATQN
ncbi:MAG: phytanoyl-CoA dioxygenase family protein [Ilumatobacteraceae bacterium]|jgi:phytanoyl-CoA hydroxylase|nr:phytanoyl-CoA dioxygenase family protein [Actinomycetota bacterium]NCX17540.1 phytanoyl-CoA dioxygenase family protein [Acidimicrobiia bacterium]NBS37143.1 phytanoyl-CoA dioxygenase family protein [Actinomycetota bacterium]NCX31606.1 phytanoyl-CoA dioxygenase family protein [Actinomycetota bacterium]NCX78335.1 phytanoyl-CoA dioxygenase family protein [Actinomycetota bacterium]